LSSKNEHAIFEIQSRIRKVIANPKSIFVNTNSEEDIQYIRDAGIANKEEARLAI
jgi:hypothetical protein